MLGFQYVNGHWVGIQPKGTRPSTAGPVAVSDFYYGLTDPGLSITLPAAATVTEGHELVIKDESGQADVVPHSILPDGADTIDGSNAALSISAKWGCLRLIQRNGRWWKIS